MEKPIQYILFSYAADGAATSNPVAALILIPLQDGAGELFVYTRRHWTDAYQESDLLQLAKGILLDWTQIPPIEAVAVFQDLKDASNGPWRAEQTGTCLPEELNAILAGTNMQPSL